MSHVRQNAEIGKHVTMLYGSSMGHDSRAADYCYLANNAIIGAHVCLEKGVYLGTNAATIERITLGEWCLAGIGAVIIRDVAPMAVVVGNPARRIKERTFDVFQPGE
jgi:acetyltransferase EpsM